MPSSVMNRQGPQPGPGQGPGFSGRTRIILPGQEGDPNRVIIPGQQNYNNNPYKNMNLNSNNMYQQNRGSMYQPDNSLYQNKNKDNSPFSSNNNPFSTNNNNPFNAINNNNQMFSPKNNLRNRQAGGGQNRRNMLQSSRSLGRAGSGLLPMGDPRCMYQFGQINTTASPGSCSLCSASRWSEISLIMSLMLLTHVTTPDWSMWRGLAMPTVTDSTPSAAWPPSGTTSGWSMRGWRGVGGPQTRGEVKQKMMFFTIRCLCQIHLLERPFFWREFLRLEHRGQAESVRERTLPFPGENRRG